MTNAKYIGTNKSVNLIYSIKPGNANSKIFIIRITITDGNAKAIKQLKKISIISRKDAIKPPSFQVILSLTNTNIVKVIKNDM